MEGYANISDIARYAGVGPVEAHNWVRRGVEMPKGKKVHGKTLFPVKAAAAVFRQIKEESVRTVTVGLERRVYRYKQIAKECQTTVNLVACRMRKAGLPDHIDNLEMFKEKRRNINPRSLPGDMAYCLEPIRLPKKLTDQDLRPFRKLAAAVLIDAIKDLDPTGREIKTEGGYERVQGLAESFLAGKLDMPSLRIWAELSGMTAEQVTGARLHKNGAARKRALAMLEPVHEFKRVAA